MFASIFVSVEVVMQLSNETSLLINTHIKRRILNEYYINIDINRYKYYNIYIHTHAHIYIYMTTYIYPDSNTHIHLHNNSITPIYYINHIIVIYWSDRIHV